MSHNLNEIEEIVNIFFKDIFSDPKLLMDNEDIDNFINKSLKSKIECLINRNRNMVSRLNSLEEINKKYNKDSQFFLNELTEKYSKEIKETLTKHQAIELVRKMTIDEIMSYGQI